MRAEAVGDEHGSRNFPLDEVEARRAAQQVLGHPGTEGVEVVISASKTGVTRYAGSQIIQNIVRSEMRAYLRAVVDGKNATATTNQLDRDAMTTAVDRALAAARAAPPDDDWPGLAFPEEVGRAVALLRYDGATADASPAARARLVGDVLKVADGHVSGVVESSSHVYGVFSSAGIDCFDATTRCLMTALVDVDGRTGWGEASSHSLTDVGFEAAARRATGKAKHGGAVGVAEPGPYHVVLEAPAAALLIDYLAFAGFGAKQVIEGESFLSTKARRDVAATRVTVSDDAAHPLSIGIGFDFEGVPKKKATVIDRGTALGPVTDRRTARVLGVEVTGHGTGSAEVGPYAMNVVLDGGESSPDELVAGIDDGLFVTRFHYVNVLDRPATLLTGMTRDGTFRIRNGEIAEPVNNLRFTISVLDALAKCEAVGSDQSTFAPDWGAFGSTVSPSLRTADFKFTSSTSH